MLDSQLPIRNDGRGEGVGTELHHPMPPPPPRSGGGREACPTIPSISHGQQPVPLLPPGSQDGVGRRSLLHSLSLPPPGSRARGLRGEAHSVPTASMGQGREQGLLHPLHCHCHHCILSRILSEHSDWLPQKRIRV